MKVDWEDVRYHSGRIGEWLVFLVGCALILSTTIFILAICLYVTQRALT